MLTYQYKDYFLYRLFSLQKKNFGPKEAEFGYPAEVLNFLRHIAPGNIKDEIREVHAL